MLNKVASRTRLLLTFPSWPDLWRFLQNRTHFSAVFTQNRTHLSAIFHKNCTQHSAISQKDVSLQIGTVRETFFFNQTRSLCSVTTSPVSDFLIDGKYTFEVGGKKKRQRQLQSIENGYVVKGDIETGYGNIIPLWMFGMLY